MSTTSQASQRIAALLDETVSLKSAVLLQQEAQISI